MSQEDDILRGFEWNQYEDARSFDRGLVTILAWDRREDPRVIGSGFIIRGGDDAVVISAAHNLVAIHAIQTPQRHHRTALAEFLPTQPPLEIDARRVRVIAVENGVVEACIVQAVAYDRGRDIAVMHIGQQERTADFFASEYLLDDRLPEIGQVVCILAYVHEPPKDQEGRRAPTQSFRLRRRIVLRAGRVVAHHLHGHLLCRGPCIETSIPIAGGMSGAPAMRLDPTGPIEVFGVVCSDPEDSIESKNDRSKRGGSIIALLPIGVDRMSSGKRVVDLHLEQAHMVGFAVPGSIPSDRE